MRRVLIVDDEEEMLETLRDALVGLPLHVEIESRGSCVLERLEKERFDLLLLDLNMPPPDGLQILRDVSSRYLRTAVVVLTGYPSIDRAVLAMKLGAREFLTKPFVRDRLRDTAMRLSGADPPDMETAGGQPSSSAVDHLRGLFGRGVAMKRVFRAIQEVARLPWDVLILGETGTGKELTARIIHAEKAEKPGPFVPVDCGAIPGDLVESELFGHEKGAYTGATAAAPGLIDLANEGTLFLDEVCELPLLQQAKLLRVLQERRVRRVGGRQELPVNLRVIAASNRDIRLEVEEGRFRQDLYYRLNVVLIQIPPLRARVEDIPLLVEHLLSRTASELGRPVPGVEAAALQALCRHPWPGNVRELQNVVRRAMMKGAATSIRVGDLPQEITSSVTAAERETFFERRASMTRAFEVDYLTRLLLRHGGDVARAAEEARIPLGTLYRLLKRHAIKTTHPRRDESTGE